MSDTATPPALSSSELKTEANGDPTRDDSKTTSLRRYGPPSGVRVVSALARFSTSISARVRCAAMPDAPTDKALNRLIHSFLPGLPTAQRESASARVAMRH